MSRPFADADVVPWTPHPIPTLGAYCNICRWTGPEFGSAPHPEGNHCPGCGSIARERALHLAWIDRWTPMEWAEVVETSPRLTGGYRDLMVRRLRYRGSDFDRRAHQADVLMDLQDIDLPDNSLDVLLTSHVLEHVPDTERALREIHRVLAPGGVAVVQVPLVEPQTTTPSVPEFHGDDTPVFWRFGWDLGRRLEDAGFEVRVHAPESVVDAVRDGEWTGVSTPEFDVDAVIAAGRGVEIHPLVPREHEPTLGFEAGYGLVTWTARVPGHATPRCAPSLAELQSLRVGRRRRDLILRRGSDAWRTAAPDGDVVVDLTWGEAFAPVLAKTRNSLGPLHPVLRRIRRTLRGPHQDR